MSLDFSLTRRVQCHCERDNCFTTEYLYDVNITHNLGPMADAAAIGHYLWFPENHGVEKASDLIKPIEEAITTLKMDPEKYRKYNASNGWGTYEHFVAFLECVVEACQAYPDAHVEVSR
jgi:hypothetical protein